MTQDPQNKGPQSDETAPEELNSDGVGGTMGADNTFEPEEDEEAPVDTDR